MSARVIPARGRGFELGRWRVHAAGWAGVIVVGVRAALIASCHIRRARVEGGRCNGQEAPE